MNSIYKSTSVYGNTKIRNWYLDYWAVKKISPDINDIPYRISANYDMRPDLAANYFYNNSDYWYIFTLRNMDKIKDPIFDFRAGLEIYVPSKKSLEGFSY